ncbi:NAD-dependent succinate-semialdehyde dehydrogenase [Crateriforma conspicua]|uniref:Succinate-semialdehyde dehydrogenase [NADP(+)] GabD n=1 Tax=Crateriforma conspicua TaxID=2527996 RepID=A0A5C5Y943_9PLAN|nr:NAD-dependent succinate-semialdehyde dehydrogenase [Crateriforma conspicua]QDV66058.1 Succinate-semialdehyde dehydrogenase [NADP(+)] GabD [Crateriforma conspicua]TWT71428.1 Succinate-semialdehyde dehydrogenase [NADP(+)] GabD [Crateriforma conspicua]
MPDQTFSLWVDGRATRTDKTFEVINPATEEVIADVPEVDADTVQRCLNSANDAFPAWSKTPLSKRKAIIDRYAERLEAHRDEIVDLLIAETGKPIDNAEYDFGMLTTCLRFFCEEAARIDQPVIPDPDGNFLNYVLRQPLGVVVGYLAWNFPLLNLGYKIGPILASGCTGIIKPSQLTPLASLRCAELLGEAGVPAGVVNVIAGTDYDVTGPLLESDIPSMFTMIGSTRAGVGAMKSACTNVKHFSVELGGNAPVLVYDDADIEAAANSIVDLKFANSGQVCVSPNRCFVHESVYEEFITKAAERVRGIVLAAGRGEGRQMGPLLTGKSRDRMSQLIQSAINNGASVVCGGKVPEDRTKGYFFEPTILRDANKDMQLSCDEIFGPILPVISFGDDDDEIALANDTEYGLAAYVYTTNLNRGLRAGAEIQAGSVCVNEVHYAVHLPHGGLKQSGVGKDCSRYSLQEYLTLKRVSVRVPS